MTTLVQSFLGGSSSFSQVASPTNMAWMSLNFGKIPSLTSELAALERQKIFFILAGNKENHNISDGFEIQ